VSFGVRVTGVEKDGPAQKAGIQEKDILQSFRGVKIRTPDDLVGRVRETPPDSTVTVGLMRGKTPVQVKVKLAKVPSFNQVHKLILTDGEGHPRLGVQIHALTDDLSGYFGVPADEGVLILEVDNDGPAMKAGLKSGDVIVRIGREKVFEPGDVTDILGGYKAGDKADVAVVRKGKESLFSVTLEKFSKTDFFNGFGPRDPADIRIFRHGSDGPMKIGEEPAIREEILREIPDRACEKTDAGRKVIEIRRGETDESATGGMEERKRELEAIPPSIEETARI
jgi:predicted metalloprotease with PDZ domain